MSLSILTMACTRLKIWRRASYAPIKTDYLDDWADNTPTQLTLLWEIIGTNLPFNTYTLTRTV